MRRPGFLTTFFGCSLQPGETADQIFGSEAHLANSLLSLFSFLLILFGPVLYYLYGFGVLAFSQTAVTSFSIVLLFFFMLWALLLTLLFYVFGLPIPLSRTIAILCYSLNPISLTLLVIYLFNYLSTGTISFHGLLFSGRLQGSDTYLRVVPYASWILTALLIYLFHCCIRAAARLSSGVAVGLTVLSVLPAAFAFVMAVTLGEVVQEGTAILFSRLLEIYLQGAAALRL